MKPTIDSTAPHQLSTEEAAQAANKAAQAANKAIESSLFARLVVRTAETGCRREATRTMCDNVTHMQQPTGSMASSKSITELPVPMKQTGPGHLAHDTSHNKMDRTLYHRKRTSTDSAIGPQSVWANPSSLC